MSRVLSDLSQLTKAMIKPKEEPKPTPAPVPKPETTVSREDADAAAVLAYFSRPPQNAPQRPCVRSGAGADNCAARADEADVAAKDAALAKLAGEKAAADRRIAELERMMADEREAHTATMRERDRLQGECGRLSGELRKTAQEGAVAASSQAAPVARPKLEKPTLGLLAANGAICETFAGETRELVLATLADALDAARQSGRERRAEVLAGVLAANRPTGELESRKAELRQILKDNGYFNDPRPLERIGMRLISGRNHWKLQYGNVRVTLAKTHPRQSAPAGFAYGEGDISDFRANLNSATEIANRCF